MNSVNITLRFSKWSYVHYSYYFHKADSSLHVLLSKANKKKRDIEIIKTLIKTAVSKTLVSHILNNLWTMNDRVVVRYHFKKLI